jgi:segregation and condensation protein A
MYKIRLTNFEGPLDLLLFFIRRDELDVYDIPISHITHEFLEYVRLMEMLDLELAGEFLVTVAMLMQIKAKMLIPREKSEDENGEEQDPREELVQRLLEYKRYKEMAEKFATLEEQQRYVYFRSLFDADVKADIDQPMENATLFHLLSAFRRVLKKVEESPKSHTIEQITVTVDEQSTFLVRSLKNNGKTSFTTLMETQTKITIVVTFLAILDLLRLRTIQIFQENPFGEIMMDLRVEDEISTPDFTDADHEQVNEEFQRKKRKKK